MNPLLDSILAAIGLVVCAGLLLRYALPAPRRQRLDARLLALWTGLRQRLRRAPRRPVAAGPQAERQARREANAVIDRAKRKARDAPGVDREGNVYRPDAFRSRPPRDKLH